MEEVENTSTFSKLMIINFNEFYKFVVDFIFRYENKINPNILHKCFFFFLRNFKLKT